MLAGHTQRILEAAAAESIEQIRRDQIKAPQRLKPLLAYIEENLFDPSLDVNQLKRNCGVRDNSVPIQFHSAVGRPPHGYIEDRRLETACRLLADSSLKIWQISELLGYSSIQVFSRAFSRWSGQRPTTYRKKQRQKAKETTNGKRPMLEESLLARTETLRKGLAGELSLAEANALISRLRRLYPDPSAAINESSSPMRQVPQAKTGRSHYTMPPMPQTTVTATEPKTEVDLWETKTLLEVRLNEDLFDDEQAEQVWQELQKHSWQDQSALVRDMRVTSPALFHLLRTRSRKIGREDPRRGVQIADLALKCLDVMEPTSLDPKELSSLKAQGWSWLGAARRLASDLRGAEQAFATAERFLHLGDRDPVIAGELALFRGLLRRDERRFDDAWELLERSHALANRSGRRDHLAAALIAKATVRYEEGNAAESIPLLEEAAGHVDDDSDAYLRLLLNHNLVTAYAETGRYSQALELLPRTRQLSAQCGRGVHRIRLRWLEGVILRGRGEFEEAESALLEAREAFARIDDMVASALVCLDLAALLARQDRLDDLQELSTSMAPLFEALQHHREAYVALQMFHRAAQERELTTAILDKARRTLQTSQRSLN